LGTALPANVSVFLPYGISISSQILSQRRIYPGKFRRVDRIRPASLIKWSHNEARASHVVVVKIHSMKKIESISGAVLPGHDPKVLEKEIYE